MVNESLQKNVISGKLASIEHRSGTMNSGPDYLAGRVYIEAGEDNVIPVSFFAAELKKDGTPNPVYSSIHTVINEFKSIESNGREEANDIEVGMPRLQENTFFLRDGRRIRAWEFQSPFFNRKTGVEPKAEFTVVGEIVRTEDEIINDVPTGNMIVTLLIVTYGSAANMVDFAVEGEKAVNYVKANFVPGMQVKVSGDIMVVEKIQEKTTEAAFGDAIVEQIRLTERKLLIQSSTAPVESPITEEQRTTMLAERESNLAQSEERAKQKNQNTQKSADFSL